MTIDYETHNQQQGQGSAKTAQGSGHEYLQRQIRRETPCAPGQDGNDCRGTVAKNRCATIQTIFLGKRYTCGSIERRSLKSCGSPRSEYPYSDTERVSRRLSSPILTPIFQASEKFSTALAPIFVTRRDLAKIHVPGFQEPSGFSKRIFAFFLKNWKTLLVNSSFLEYNALITSGQSILSTPDSSPLLPPRRDNRRQDGLVSH